MSDAPRTLTLRRLSPDDAPTFKALRMEAFRLAPSAFRSAPEDEAAMPLAETQATLARDFVAGLFSGETLVGMAGIAILTRVKLRHKAEIFGVYLRAEHRGGGGAGRLIGMLLDHAAGRVESVNLVVSADNRGAIRLYERWGFAIFGVETRSLKLPDGTLVDEAYMAKKMV